MAELDITLTIYSDRSKGIQLASKNLYVGPTLDFELWRGWDWAKKHGFTVYAPQFYDPGCKELYRNSGTDVPKWQLVEWLDEGVLTTRQGKKVDGTSALRYYPRTCGFNIRFVDWS